MLQHVSTAYAGHRQVETHKIIKQNCMLSGWFLPDNGRRKVKFSLEQAMKAQRGSREIALLFL
jgi:hypothetical protein